MVNKLWIGDERRESSDDRLRSIELQLTRLVAHQESGDGNVASMIANIIKEQSKHDDRFEEHRKDDDINFKRIDKTIAWASGALAVVIVVVRAIFK